MVDTFFAGSAASAATALLGLTQKLTPREAAALRRAIDLAGEENEKHSEREGAGEGKLDDELGEIARAEEGGLLHREERADGEERKGQREVFDEAGVHRS